MIGFTNLSSSLRLAATGLVLLAGSAPAAAQAAQPAPALEPAPPPEEKHGPGHPSVASAGGTEPRVVPDRAGLFPWSPLNLIEPPIKDLEKWLSENARLDIGFRETLAFQQATGGDERTASSHDERIYGTFHAWNWEEEKKGWAGNFYARLEYRDRIGEIAPFFLNSRIGTLFTTTYGDDEHDPALVQLYYEQFLLDGDLRLRLGKLDPDDYYNLGRWADDYRYFENTLFSAFPGANHPSGGLGWNLQWAISPEWTLTGGFSDVQGRKTQSGFSSFFEDFELFSAIDLTWSPVIDGWGQGNYRFGVEYRDAIDDRSTPHDGGFYINVDQEVAKDIAPFLRFWHGKGNTTGVETVFSLGLAAENCFNRPGDATGIGLGFDLADDDIVSDRDIEYAVETFYRWQLTRAMQFMLGYQIIIEPVLDEEEDTVGVFEARLLIEF